MSEALDIDELERLLKWQKSHGGTCKACMNGPLIDAAVNALPVLIAERKQLREALEWNDDVTPEAVEEIRKRAKAPLEDDPDWKVIDGPAW